MASQNDIVARHVGARIRQLRDAKGLPLQAVADQLAVEREDMERAERGELLVSLKQLVALAALGDVSVDWFFRNTAIEARNDGEVDEATVARFMTLNEAPPMMNAFVRVPDRAGRMTVVGFAAMLAPPTSTD